MIDIEQIEIKIDYLKTHFPDEYQFLDIYRTKQKEFFTFLESEGHLDFEKNSDGGRGQTYNQAQIDPTVRAEGIFKLIHFLLPEGQTHFTPGITILDVLGGDGVVARALKQSLSKTRLPCVLTGDISQEMVEAAFRYNLPAVLQSAEYLSIKDSVIDGVLIAYGVHHIHPKRRQLAVNEAFRVLKSRGKIVLHDFEERGPVARWFSQVVHKYSITGHPYIHFSSQEMTNLLQSAGFCDITINQLYDPFILFGTTREDCKEKLSDYIMNMYGLFNLPGSDKTEVKQKIFSLACDYFQYDYKTFGLSEKHGKKCVTLEQVKTGWRIELPRLALVAVGKKT